MPPEWTQTQSPRTPNKVETRRFHFDDICQLPPPGIIAFDEVAYPYSDKPQGYLHKSIVVQYTYGHSVDILGANDAGKSILLNLVSGVQQPYHSTVSLSK
ncbi:hypothetical protein EDD22DRAFT_955908 [Suillus occidentalis]|nr:hypothetical protein EDD22DRAFT_955908 [Suillus occidentalis]